MKNFWPKRPSPNGFSIENIARNYKERLKEKIQEDNQDHGKGQFAKNVVGFENSERLDKFVNVSKIKDIGKYHWANRDFNEYLDIA